MPNITASRTPPPGKTSGIAAGDPAATRFNIKLD
jgi:hypothetical protein